MTESDYERLSALLPALLTRAERMSRRMMRMLTTAQHIQSRLAVVTFPSSGDSSHMVVATERKE